MKKILAFLLTALLAVSVVALVACEPAHQHTLQHTTAVAATCVTDGNVEYWHCADCGKYFADEAATKEITSWVTSKLDHDWDEGSVTTAATCTTAGEKTLSCKRDGCDETKTEPIAALGHKATHVDGVAATCTTAGKAEHWNCATCKKNFSDEACTKEIADLTIAALGHKMTENKLVAATCTEDGTKAHWNCSVCKKNFADKDGKTEITDLKIAKLNHKWDDGNITTDATCTTKGVKTFKCTNSGCKEEKTSDINALGHSKTEVKVVAATCTTAGTVAHWNCATCKKNFEDEACTKEITDLTIAALGHAFDQGSNFTATHGTWSCTRTDCGHTEQRVVWGNPITVNGKEVTDVYGALSLDESKNTAYAQGDQARVVYANTKVTSGNYIYKAVINTQSLNASNTGCVVGMVINSGTYTSTLNIKSAWWEINNICIEINGNEISVGGFAHRLHSVEATSTLTITVKRVDNTLYLYDGNDELAVILDANGVHPQGGRNIINQNGLAYINEHLKEFFANGKENVCGAVAIGMNNARADFAISITNLSEVSGTISLPEDVTADLTQTRLVVKTGAIYETYTGIVDANGNYSVMVPYGTHSFTFTNPAILGADVAEVVANSATTTVDVQLIKSSASKNSVVINNQEIKFGKTVDDATSVEVATGAEQDLLVANSVYGGEAKYHVAFSLRGAGYGGLLTAGITDGSSIVRISMRNGYQNLIEFEYCLVNPEKTGYWVSNYRTFFLSASFLPTFYYGHTYDSVAEGFVEFTFHKKADGTIDVYYGTNLLVAIKADGFYIASGVTSDGAAANGRLPDKNGCQSIPETAFLAVGREYAAWTHVDGMTGEVVIGVKARIEPILPAKEEQ